jgi:DNA polymerase-3 subunit epsilon
MHFVIVDIETTGGNPQNSKITEIAMYKCDGEQIIDEFVTLINPETSIPPFIVNLTGITDRMVENAPLFEEVAQTIEAFSEGCIFVAHNVGFDYGMIRAEFKALGKSFSRPNMCTVKASRLVIPGYESYGLGKITRALGIEIKGRHRAGGDAYATTILFQLLYKTNKDLLLAQITSNLTPDTLNPKLDYEAVTEIPNKTGLYVFYNEFNQIIFIGKSKKIRKQVEVHLETPKSKKALVMRTEITRIDFHVTQTEYVAKDLHKKLIIKHTPKYNTIPKKTIN